MGLPRRYLWSITEVAARLGCMPADIIDWSMRGHIRICTTIATVMTTNGERAGLMEVPPEDFVRMFRRDGSGPKLSTVRRIRTRAEDQWSRITDPAPGIHLEAADLVITADDLEGFEDTHDLTPKRAGGAARWDWEGFYTALIRRIHEKGLPEKQMDLVDEMQGWFERRSDDGASPDVSTIRKKVSIVWRELRPD